MEFYRDVSAPLVVETTCGVLRIISNGCLAMFVILVLYIVFAIVFVVASLLGYV